MDDEKTPPTEPIVQTTAASVIDEPDSADEATTLNNALTALSTHCANVGITATWHQTPKGSQYLGVQLPGETRDNSVYVFSTTRANQLMGLPLHQYHLFAKYQGYYAPDTVEVAVRSRGAVSGMRKLMESITELAGARYTIPCTTTGRYQGVEVSLGEPSGAFEALFFGALGGAEVTVQVKGLPVASQAVAQKIVEQIVSNIVLQLDHALGVPCVISHRRDSVLATVRKIPSHKPITDLVFPTSRYDPDPVSLYWYARSSVGLPLLQFLAYYQVVEFYFPHYSQIEARRRAKQILASPEFSPHNDADILRMLEAVQVGLRGSGEERAQLKATLLVCIGSDEMLQFFKDREHLIRFFTAQDSRKQALGVSDVGLPLHNLKNTPDIDLRNEVADRLYDIRCKIVHSKAGNGREGTITRILPFTPEASALWADIEIMRWVAARALFSGAAPLDI